MTEVVLIKKSKNSEESNIQEANANLLADERIKETSATNPLYIVRVEDPTLEAKTRTFAALKLRDDNPICLEVIGIELELETQQNALEKYNDVIALAKNGELAVDSIRFPWHRVISIKNKTYKHKGVK